MSTPDPTSPSIPKSLIRLCTALHSYRPGIIESVSKLGYEEAFKSAGGHHAKTASLLRNLSQTRLEMASALTTTTSPSDSLASATRYLPLIRTLLLSCEVQPDTAVLDKKLEFQWRGGLEGDDVGGTVGKVRTSQALMYELTMTIGVICLSHASIACQNSLKGDFVAAVNDFKSAANVMEHLRSTHLPQWVALGSSTSHTDLPCECSVSCAKGFAVIFKAHAQQMAVAKALTGDNVNYSLVGKLCKGICEDIQEFVKVVRGEAGVHWCRMPVAYLKYVAFQTSLQTGLSLYFQARSIWKEGKEYGMALRVLKTGRESLEVRRNVTSPGIPEDINSSGNPLSVLRPDLTDLKSHIDSLIVAWTTDVETVYFDKVPQSIPEGRKIKEGMHMVKYGAWEEEGKEGIEPVPLAVKGGEVEGDSGMGGGGEWEAMPPTAPRDSEEGKNRERSDSDLARELQAKLNAGEDI